MLCGSSDDHSLTGQLSSENLKSKLTLTRTFADSRPFPWGNSVLFREAQVGQATRHDNERILVTRSINATASLQ
jgi:hypothetical protein